MFNTFKSWFLSAESPVQTHATPRVRLGCERLEVREMPAVLFNVNTASDTSDANLGDNVAADVNGKTSLRSVIEQVNATGLPSETYQVFFVGTPPVGTDDEPPPPQPPLRIELSSALDAIKYRMEFYGSSPTTDRVTIAKAAGSPPNFTLMTVTNAGNVTLNNMHFEGADNRGGTGGAVYSDGTLAVINCVFNGNASDHGGAIASSGALTVTDTNFFQNRGYGHGGAVDLGGGGAATFTRCTFTGNFAGAQGAQPGGPGTNGGALSLRFQATATIADCRFQDNSAGNGGAIYLSVPTQLAGITVTGTTRFVNNYAHDDGGAIYNSGGSLSLTDTDFLGNRAGLNGGCIHTKTGAVTLLRVHFGLGNRAAGPLGAHLVANEAGATVTVTNCIKDDPADIFVVLV